MLRPFFAAAMVAPARQLTFRRVAVAHVVFLFAVAWLTAATGTSHGLATFGYVLLSLAMVEAAALVGWRLTQLPKSQALEFLLVSPVQPVRLFLAESLVGLSRFALAWLGGLPVFLGLMLSGAVEAHDLFPLMAMPFVWGAAVALLLTAFVYEPVWVRRIGELLGLIGVLAYLTVGVLAGENLVVWLRQLPPWLGQFLFDGVMFTHTMNPFGVVRYWFGPDCVGWVAWERAGWLTIAGGLLLLLTLLRAAFRLKGHYHDRHYTPISSARASQAERIGDKPLSWWAVRRVMEFGGRINLWLAGGFSTLFAVYVVAGDDWPAWMGRLVFQIFEQWGGPAGVASAMVVMAAVPAVFQYGLWDNTVPDRCKRLELLLLTDLQGVDYWHASLASAWRRGRGYLVIAGMLWVAMGVGGRASWECVVAAAVGGVAFWAFGFAVGFRAFASGNQTSGLSSVVILGLPLLVWGLLKANQPDLAGLIPTGLSYLPVSGHLGWGWAVGLVGTLSVTAWLTAQGLAKCDPDLRRWYDANQGRRAEA